VSRIGEILQRARDQRLFSGAAWSVGTAGGELDGGRPGTLDARRGRDRVGSPAGDLLGPRAYGHTGRGSGICRQ
jgi:hypothetical protein